MSAIVELDPTKGRHPQVVLQDALNEAKPGDTVFVLLISGEDIHITSSRFTTRDLAWAAAVLNYHALNQAGKPA